MKSLRSSLFRALCTIAVGVLLIMHPDSTVSWLTVAIGVLFLLSGILSCLTYVIAMRRYAAAMPSADTTAVEPRVGRPLPPVVGIGSVVLGLMMALAPSLFVSGLMYVLGAMLVLGALGQLMALLGVRKLASVPWALWVCPSLVLLTGVYVIVRPFETASMSLVVIGWCSLLYGVVEIINSLKIYAWQKRYRELQSQDTTQLE